jgi:hypothetical protein
VFEDVSAAQGDCRREKLNQQQWLDEYAWYGALGNGFGTCLMTLTMGNCKRAHARLEEGPGCVNLLEILSGLELRKKYTHSFTVMRSHLLHDC